MSPIAIEIIIILLLLAANGLFAMTEIAVVSARKARLRRLADTGDAKAKAALELAESPNRFLATVQVGITLVGVLESDGALRLLQVQNHGTLSSPQLRLRLLAGEPLVESVAPTLRRTLGLDFDARRLAQFALIIVALSGLAMLTAQNPARHLAIALAEQDDWTIRAVTIAMTLFGLALVVVPFVL